MRLWLLMLFIGFSLILSLSYDVICGDCDLEMRKGHPEDLTRALHCLDDRIKELEIKIADGERRSDVGKNIDKPTAFDAGMFEASVRGASREDKRINVNVFIKNKTTEPIYLLMDDRMRAVLVDEKSGKTMRFGSKNGITATDEGQIRMGYVKQEHCTPVPINGSINIGLLFYTDGDSERLLGLTLHLYRLKDRQFTKVAVPLSVTLAK